jgi:hypothetical protein
MDNPQTNQWAPASYLSDGQRLSHTGSWARSVSTEQARLRKVLKDLDRKSSGFLHFGTEFKYHEFRGYGLRTLADAAPGVVAALTHDGPVLVGAEQMSPRGMPLSGAVRSHAESRRIEQYWNQMSIRPAILPLVLLGAGRAFAQNAPASPGGGVEDETSPSVAGSESGACPAIVALAGVNLQPLGPQATSH